MEDNMRNLVICGLILLTLALNCEATEPVNLSGSYGQAILSQIAGPGQTNNTSANFGQTNNTSTNNLWNWGGTPNGYMLNNTGAFTPFQYENNSGVWTPSI